MLWGLSLGEEGGPSTPALRQRWWRKASLGLCPWLPPSLACGEGQLEGSWVVLRVQGSGFSASCFVFRGLGFRV